MSNRSSIRKIFQKIGLDVHKYHPAVNRLAWLKDFNIKTVFDIGANVGQFASEIREHLPNAQIYSFEPLKECYDKLIQDFKNDHKLKAFNMALGDSSGQTTINKSSYSLSSSLLSMADSHKKLFPHTKDHTSETIEIKTLDEVAAIIKPEPEILIKVDTQGYEDKVIRGGLDTFKKARVAILEASYVPLYDGQPLFNDIYKAMKLLGFDYQGSLHQKINPKTGQIIFEDSIYIRS